MNCYFKDVSTPTQGNDADQRCLDECFSLKPGANQHKGGWDFLVWQIRLPTKDANDEHESNKLVWTFEVPADDTSNNVVASFSCTTASNYFTSDGVFGMDSGMAGDYPNSVEPFGTRTNSYDSEVSLSVSSNTGSV